MDARQALRYFHTIRHLRTRQVVGRLLHGGRFELYRLAPSAAAALYPAARPAECQRIAPVCSPPAPTLAPESRGFPESRARADLARQGRTELLSMAGSLYPPVDWHPRSRPKLWRYFLHYMEVAVDLALAYRVTGEPAYASSLRALIDDWILSNPVGSEDAWEPHPLAKRIPHWLVALDLLGDWDPALAQRACRSIARQLDFLDRHVEWHLLGNHLVCNLAALVIGACGFAGERRNRMLARRLRQLREQVQQQILSDGLHCELSTTYHVAVLSDLLRVAGALRARRAAPAPWLEEAVCKMAETLRDLLHPDGAVPLLGDSAADLCPPAADILDPWSLFHRLYATGDLVASLGPSPPSYRRFPDSGLHVARSGGEYLVFDGGPVGAASQPAHGHSDTLGFELSHAGRRTLVDAGVSTYDAGALRDYFRAARAHNVVTVDLEGPDELWAAFRLGRRSRVESCRVEHQGRSLRAHAELRAFQGWHHTRDLLWDPAAGLAVVDRVSGAANGTVRSHLHVDPSLDAQAAGDVFIAGDLEITKLRGAHWEACRGDRGPPLRGWHAERIGNPTPAWELAVVAQPAEVQVTAWMACWAPGFRQAALAIASEATPGCRKS